VTLKEYLKKLQKLGKENPKALELTVITSADDEGNDFNEVHYEPSLGFFENREFDPTGTPNAVCLN
jgi:hypothetical protein